MHLLKKLEKLSPKTILAAIVILAALLRFYNLGGIPGSVNRDEAALGYNAYSIIETGKDEFGNSYPLTFPSFGDYKLPGYIYGSIPFIKIFGLNDFSTRLLSALAGTLLVITIYQLAYTLTRKQPIALLSALTLAIAPWAIFYSRIAFETNVATFLLSTGLLLLLKGLKTPWLWNLSAILIVASLFTYNNPYIVGPVLLLVFFIFHYQKLLNSYPKHQIIIPLIILVTGAFLALQTVWSVNQAKANVTIFKSPEILEEFWTYRKEITAEGGSLASIKLKLIGNQYVYYGAILISNILKNFSPAYLTIRDSSHIWNGIPGIGHFYYIDYILLIIGTIGIFKLKDNFSKSFIISWMLVGVIPAAITIHQAQSNRGILSFFIFQIVIAIGIYQIFTTKLKFALPIIASVYLLSINYLIVAYFIQFPQDSKGWQPQLGTSIHSVNALNPHSLVISKSISESYIYYLYYSAYDPTVFQTTVDRTKDALGFYTVHSFGHIYTGEITDTTIARFKEQGSVAILGISSDPVFTQYGIDQQFKSTKDFSFAYKLLPN